MSLPLLVVIAGTTASGKSAFAIDLALELKGEIICADSRQVYKGLDIGAGKVSQEEQALVPHHLLDVWEVQENFTLANYLPLAHEALAAVLIEDHLPFLVGGTGLYISGVVENYHVPVVAPNPELRQELSLRAPEQLMKQLQELDPQAAERININDSRRLVRALEVCLTTGESFSNLRTVGPPLYDSLVFALDWPRPVLYQRIDARVDSRMKAGMVEEVETLLNQGVPPERLYQLGLEYRIIAEYLMGLIPTEEVMTGTLKNAIHAFARRQLTWFRQKKNVKWLDATQDYRQEALEEIRSAQAGRE